MQLRRFLASFVLLSVAASLRAVTSQTDSLPHWGATISVMPGRALALDRFAEKWLQGRNNFSVDLQIHHSPLPQDSDAYASDYNYPTLSLGVKYAFNHGVTMHRYPDEAWGQVEEVDYFSRMGNSLTVYGVFARPIMRTNEWEIDYTLGTGIAYNRHKYNTYNNIDNELIGSRWLIYFGAGLHATYRFAADWGVKAGIDFYHHSNGALNRPNKGANIIAPSLGLTYYPYYKEVADRGRNRIDQPFEKYWYLCLTAGVGGKTLLEDWLKTQFYTSPGAPEYRTDRFHFYTAYSFQGDVMYRYARRWASGVGLDLFYGNYASHLKAMDLADGRDLKHSPWSFGIAARHEVFYRNLSVNVALGWYVYREMGYMARLQETSYYERVGLKYTFPRFHGMALGFNVKAHGGKADLTELTLSYPVVLKKSARN